MRKITSHLAFVMLVLMLAAGIAAAQDGAPMDAILAAITFQPIDDILTGELTVTNFASDGTATLPNTTTIPVACSIVYGKTLEFGTLAVDTDMNGGTHTDHHPLLTDLEPETTYFYRVQGTDDHGVIYLSDTMSFTTPVQQTVENTNLASPELGAEIIGYSSAYGGADPSAAWGVLSALDGSANSAWSSAGDGDNAWFEIQLAQDLHITQIAYWSRMMTDGTSQVIEFTVTSDDGTVYGPFTVPDATQSYSFDVDFNTTTLRFEVVSSTGGNTGAVEFAAYGETMND